MSSIPGIAAYTLTVNYIVDISNDISFHAGLSNEWHLSHQVNFVCISLNFF